jgi:hypothetical protein
MDLRHVPDGLLAPGHAHERTRSEQSQWYRFVAVTGHFA